MTIEIRPAAVRQQIAEKSRQMDAMAKALNGAHGKVDHFCSTDSNLKGAGFDAARSHMGQYKDFCLAAHECIEMTRHADQQVTSALGVFGGMGRVSEQEYLDKQRDAQQQASSFRSQANSIDWNRDIFDLDAMYRSWSLRWAARSWQRNADEAGRMLSKIYSYCEQTNGLYGGDLGKLANAVQAGAQSFASCSFDAATGAWGKFDSSWKSDEVQAIIEDNLDVLLFKGYGDVDRALLVDPVVSGVSSWWEDTTDAVADWWNDPDNSFARWWDDNSTTIENVGKVVFGVAGCVGAVAMIATGVGAPAGIAAIIGLTSGLADVGTGIAGLATGENIEWQEKTGGKIASALGFDEEAGVFAVETMTTLASLYNISKLPQNAGKLVGSAGKLFGSAEAAETVHSGVKSVKTTTSFASGAPLFTGRAATKATKATKAEFARDLGELSDGVDSAFGAVGDFFDGLNDFSKSKRMEDDGYADVASTAIGYGY